MKAMKFFAVMSVIGSLLTGCFAGTSHSTSNIANAPTIDWGEVTTNDLIPLEDGLSTSYALEELWNFFAPHNINTLNSDGWLSYSDINQRFPIEITRSSGYSVYRVNEGGYYYIFWVNTYDPDSLVKHEYPQMYFSTYISSSVAVTDFSDVVPEENTLSDIILIDPYCELQYHLSSSICSFSYLTPETVQQISYKITSEGFPDSNELVVTNQKTVERKNAPSYFSIILDSDLP